MKTRPVHPFGRALFGALALMFVATTESAALQDNSTFINGFGMEFIRVQAGSTTIGRFQPTCPAKPNAAPANSSPASAGPGGRGGARAPVDPRARWTDADYDLCAELARQQALPGFAVHIRRSFYLGTYEITQSQFERVMGRNPSVFNSTKLGRDASNYPVDNVSWEDAQHFITELNRLDKTSRYRLPTEFEWEYAARAGREGEPGWPEVRNAAWIQDADKGSTHAVGIKAVNGWGLHDMLGNVWEWVSDVYNEQLFADSLSGVHHKLLDKPTHVLKGGSFVSDVKNATWSTHAGGPGSGFDVGFRVVRESRN